MTRGAGDHAKTSNRQATLIVFSGLPGVGKTTIARALAGELGAVYLRVDSIEAGLECSSLRIRPAEDAGYRALLAVANDNLASGRVVIADAVNPLLVTREWFADLAAKSNACLLNVEVVCSNAAEHRRRVEARLGQAQDPALPTWAEVQGRPFEAWSGDRLTLDTCRLSVAECVMTITDAVRGAIRSLDFASLRRVAGARRSARTILPDPIPPQVLDDCVDIAIQAPSSHNLEVWRFVDVRDETLREALGRFCLNQAQALQAPTLIVVIARPDLWRVGCRRMLDRLERDVDPAPADAAYARWLPLLMRKYRVMVPLLFNDGPLHVLAPLKSLIMWLWALRAPMMRGPFGRVEQELWAVKSSALACENFMLALAAVGFDSCAMEGFDEPRIKRLLRLPRAARIVMVIAAGRRGPDALIRKSGSNGLTISPRSDRYSSSMLPIQAEPRPAIGVT